jgi:Na+/melibiose symporter-like transporter
MASKTFEYERCQMTKWAFVTTLLYICLVVIVFMPLVAWAAFYNEVDASDILGVYTAWQFWLLCGIITVIQALMLLFPVRTVAEAPKPQRLIWVPVVTAALLFSILVLGVLWSILAAIWGDDCGGAVYTWASLAFFAVSWLIWSILFYRFYRNTEPRALTQRLTTWLLRGSILELLIALPSHVIVRRRGDCSAPGITWLGIAAGLVIMALAFGPGLFFLFRKRFEKMKPRSKRNNHQLSNQPL